MALSWSPGHDGRKRQYGQPNAGLDRGGPKREHRRAWQKVVSGFFSIGSMQKPEDRP
jgi:hypothetical protein